MDELDVIIVGGGVGFIAADVEVGAGGDGGYFADYVVDELVGQFVIGVQGAEAYAGTGVGFGGLAVQV